MTGSPRPVLLDTTIAIAAFRLDGVVLAHMRTVRLIVSSTMIGELYFGARRSGRFTEQADKIADLVVRSRVVFCDLDTSAKYGRLKYALELMGARILENDMWIAASALQYGLPLVTRDAHFDRVPGLTVERW